MTRLIDPENGQDRIAHGGQIEVDDSITDEGSIEHEEHHCAEQPAHFFHQVRAFMSALCAPSVAIDQTGDKRTYETTTAFIGDGIRGCSRCEGHDLCPVIIDPSAPGGDGDRGRHGKRDRQPDFDGNCDLLDEVHQYLAVEFGRHVDRDECDCREKQRNTNAVVQPHSRR